MRRAFCLTVFLHAIVTLLALSPHLLLAQNDKAKPDAVKPVSLVVPVEFHSAKRLNGHTLKGYVVSFDERIVEYTSDDKGIKNLTSIGWHLLTANSRQLLADRLRRALLKAGGQGENWLTLGAVYQRNEIDETNATVAFEIAQAKTPELAHRVKAVKEAIRQYRLSPEARLRRAMTKPWWTVEDLAKIVNTRLPLKLKVVSTMPGERLDLPEPVELTTTPYGGGEPMEGTALSLLAEGVKLRTEDGKATVVPWLDVAAGDAYTLHETAFAGRATGPQWLALGMLLDQLIEGPLVAERAYAEAVRCGEDRLPYTGRLLVYAYIESKTGKPIEPDPPIEPKRMRFSHDGLKKAKGDATKLYAALGTHLKTVYHMSGHRRRVYRGVAGNLYPMLPFVADRHIDDDLLNAAIAEYFVLPELLKVRVRREYGTGVRSLVGGPAKTYVDTGYHRRAIMAGNLLVEIIDFPSTRNAQLQRLSYLHAQVGDYEKAIECIKRCDFEISRMHGAALRGLIEDYQKELDKLKQEQDDH